MLRWQRVTRKIGKEAMRWSKNSMAHGMIAGIAVVVVVVAVVVRSPQEGNPLSSRLGLDTSMKLEWKLIRLATNAIT